MEDNEGYTSYSCYWEYETKKDVPTESGKVAGIGDVYQLGSMQSDTRKEFIDKWGIPDNVVYSGGAFAEQMKNWGNSAAN